MKRTNSVKYYLAVFVAFVTLMVYLPALQNDFVNWDDNVYVYENVHIRSLGADFFKWAFFESQRILWHPLTWISHAVDYALWGLDPRGHHLSSVLLHGLNTLLVVLLSMRLVEAWGAKRHGGDPEGLFSPRRTLLVGAITGFLFGLHPLHVESVVWVAERKDVLYVFFFLLSVLSYLRYGARADEREGMFFQDRRYLSGLGFFVLALLSKPMAITLPLVLLIIDWHPLGRFGERARLKKIILEKIPFFGFSLLTTVITVMPAHFAAVLTPIESRPFSTRVLVGAGALISYLGKMVWPASLFPLYPYPMQVSFWSPAYFMPVLLVLAITIACVALSRTRKLWLALWAYYIATLLPVLGLVPFGPHAMADRYTYLSAIGPFLLMALGGAWIIDKASDEKQKRPLVRTLAVAAACVLLLSLSALTFEQIRLWKNSLVLWNYVIQRDPGIPQAYNNRGIIYKQMGLLNNAIEDYNRAIALDPFCYEAYYNRGRALSAMGRPDQATEDYGRAIAVNPSYVEAYNYRGMAFDDLGRPDKAIEDYDRAIALDRSYYKAYHNKGTLFSKTGMPDKAIAAFNDSLAIAPDYADAYYSRGVVYASIGRNDSALEDFNKAILLNQDDAAVYLNRGRLYLRDGNKERAGADFRNACYRGNNDGCNELH